MQKMVIFGLLILIAIVGIGAATANDGGILPFNPRTTNLPFVRVGDTPVRVTVADTAEEQRRGLSGTPSLAPGTGMLFVFDRDDTYKIWMKDMNYAIDVLWISAAGEVVGIEEHLVPESYPELFGPDRPVRYVLEVPADFVQTFNIRLGDPVTLLEQNGS